ncbi:DUF1206 domain-containing protein [Sphingomonas sp. RS2018]
MNAGPKLTMLTRLGFAARGILYLVIGFLIIGTGRTEDTSGALQYLASGGGRVLMLVMAAGLIAYGVWRLVDATLDIERHGHDRKGVLERAGAGLSGVVHLVLAWQAVQLIRGIEATGGGAQGGARAALDIPGGHMLLMLVGVVLAALGVVQLVKAWKAKFLRYLEPQVANRAWALWSGRAGYAARGLVFMISGYLLLQAGLHKRASEAGGMEESLTLLSSPADVVIAAGLFCFGVFSLIEARFRILHDVPVDSLAHKAIGVR